MTNSEDGWKSSKFRVGLIAVMIFLITALTMHLVGLPNILYGSLVLSGGYIAINIILAIAKGLWIKHFYR